MLKFNGAEKAYSNFADCTIFVEVGRKYQFGFVEAQRGCNNDRSLQKSVSTKLQSFCGSLCGVLETSHWLSHLHRIKFPIGLCFFSLHSSPLLAFKLNRQMYSVYIIFPMSFSEIVCPVSYITALC